MSERVYISFSLGLFETPRSHKVAISLPDLVRETNAFSHQYEGGCAASLQESNPQDLFLRYNVKCSKPDSNPAGHDVRVHFDVSKLNETQMARDLDVRVSCTCEAFLYWGAQWNLHQRDGLEGAPRPKLQAPTERLDLRGHFVVCKHCYVVFKRILPSVQHNIVKILREREVEHNKEIGKGQETPERLEKEQERMKKKKEIEKLRKTKGVKEEEVLDALRKEEEEKMQKEQKTPAWMKLPQHYEEAIERNQPATLIDEIEEQEPKPPEHMPEPEQSAMRELYKEDIKDRRKKHHEVEEEGELHVHEGLPYETEEEEEEEE
jgi:hypothetical protein